MKMRVGACSENTTIVQTIWGHALREVPHGAWTRTAVHEAGHGAAASVLRRGLQSVHLFRCGHGPAGAAVLTEAPSVQQNIRRGSAAARPVAAPTMHRNATWWAREAQVALAGLAAEWIVLGSMADCGAADDLVVARDAATAALRLPRGRAALGPWRQTTPPPEWLAALAGDDDRLFDYLHAAFGSVFRLMVTRDSEIATLALELLDHGELPAARVHAVVRDASVRPGAVEALIAPYDPCPHEAA